MRVIINVRPHRSQRGVVIAAIFVFVFVVHGGGGRGAPCGAPGRRGGRGTVRLAEAVQLE